MRGTSAVTAGARLGIVLLAFGMTPVLVLLVTAPKGGVPGADWSKELKVANGAAVHPGSDSPPALDLEPAFIFASARARHGMVPRSSRASVRHEPHSQRQPTQDPNQTGGGGGAVPGAGAGGASTMRGTSAVTAGARLGIVLLAFGMTPVLVLLVTAPKGGVPHTGRSPHAGRGGGGGALRGREGARPSHFPDNGCRVMGGLGWLGGWGTCDMEVGTSPGADWSKELKVANGAAVHPGSDSP
eukprot:CAMPEP_0119545146 /NCGR_PEP_ID=MMETSP1344-20130328/55093_1 /TAXON_ID=236787 /ORGANISM="Florenciella parvula, Strain CCMP2471" /LENGTH=241 /DNA_ID=CAMNT_0007589659 /DNA_START=747 /DNA_END=1469 /DNA_ORIENTATION=-